MHSYRLLLGSSDYPTKIPYAPPPEGAHQGSGAILQSPPALGHFLLVAADYGDSRGSYFAVRPVRDRNLVFAK